ncbi:MAG: class I SAM-dependent methyltransferase [Desulfobacteraceae bacterium]|nr:MAG: class I SAM-dependent methyltransferase [Desulfobacteraceae bacterium]
MIDILNMGALNLALGIGYQLGLFDVMDAMGGPAGSRQIAGKSGLNQRYIEEWLGVMATGGVITVSRADDGVLLFHLPKAHGDFLTRRSGNSNLGVYTQEIPLLNRTAMDGVLKGFTTGEGVPYETYGKFQSFMSELADAKHRQVLVDTFLPSVAKGEVVSALQKGIRVCDLGCGQGVAVCLMAKAFPNSWFVGLDISGEAIRDAAANARQENLSNAEFRCLDAAKLSGSAEFGNAFQYITAFDSIHDQTRPMAALHGVYHMLRPGGFFSMVDIAASSDLSKNLDHPMGPFLYTVSLMHCMPVGLVDKGRGLGMMWGREKALDMLARAGFSDIKVESIPEDSFNDHFLCRK